jgi:hypothetical protein
VVRYQHTQLGTTILVVCLAVLIVLATIATVSGRPALVLPLLATGGVLVLSAILFCSLTIVITNRELIWRFGPGLIRKRVALQEIASVEKVKTSVLEGWGIHYTRFGWLYNVSGFHAVAVTLQGGKRFALGTDEPEKLEAALGSALRDRASA